MSDPKRTRYASNKSYDEDERDEYNRPVYREPDLKRLWSWIPEDGISAEPLIFYLREFLDTQAQIRPGVHAIDKKAGYHIQAAKALTRDDLIQIINDSRDWKQELKTGVRQYTGSETAKRRLEVGRRGRVGKDQQPSQSSGPRVSTQKVDTPNDPVHERDIRRSESANVPSRQNQNPIPVRTDSRTLTPSQRAPTLDSRGPPPAYYEDSYTDDHLEFYDAVDRPGPRPNPAPVRPQPSGGGTHGFRRDDPMDEDTYDGRDRYHQGDSRAPPSRGGSRPYDDRDRHRSFQGDYDDSQSYRGGNNRSYGARR